MAYNSIAGLFPVLGARERAWVEENPVAGQERGKKAEGVGALALVGQLGLAVAAPIVLGAFCGAYLEKRYGGGGVILIGGVLGGVVLGFLGAYRIVSPYLD